jgi:hypothetical protein
MGYFNRQLDRGRCASEVDAAVARQSAAGLSPWLVATANRAGGPTRNSYLRFAVGRMGAASHHRLGIFRAAGALEEGGILSDHERGRLRRALRWFNKKLRVPRVTSRAVFWFKADAAECVGRVWQIVRLLDAHDTIVWMMRSEWPGQVVYEDCYQLAALPGGAKLRRCRPVR